jgi:hypothetical protein
VDREEEGRLMKPTRLYTVQITEYPGDSLVWKREDDMEEWEYGSEVETSEDEDGYTWFGFQDPDWMPDEWPEYAAAHHIVDHRATSKAGTTIYARFFWPSTDRIYRSRSSAQHRVDLINRWGGAAILVETDTDWQPVTVANARRRNARRRAQIARLREQANRLAADMEEE